MGCSRECHVRVRLPVTSKWHTPPQPTTKIPICGVEKKGIRFIHHSTTLSAISWAVGGVRQRLFNPSPPKSPRASIGYSQSALQRAPAEISRQSPRGGNRAKYWANIEQISGCSWHWALYLAPIDPLARYSPITMPRNVLLSGLH